MNNPEEYYKRRNNLLTGFPEKDSLSFEDFKNAVLNFYNNGQEFSIEDLNKFKNEKELNDQRVNRYH